MGYCDIQGKCKICNSDIEYRLYIGDNGDTWTEDDIVTCEKCKTQYKLKNEDLEIYKK